MTHQSILGVAIVNADRTHPSGTAIMRPWIDGSWPLRGDDPARWAAYVNVISALVAVAYRRPKGRRMLTVIDVRWVLGATITGGRVDFETVPAPMLEYLIGQPSPALWKRGEGWPIKVIDLKVGPATAKAPIAA